VNRLRHLAAASLLAACAPALADANAEFAIRWDPAEGGPQTSQEVLAALGLAPDRERDFMVRYFTVAQPDQLPEGFAAIARERTSGDHTEATYKLRGPAPFPTSGPLHKWRCPLKGHADSKEEVDISWTGDAQPKRAYSRSCTADAGAAKAMPKGLKAQPLGCSAAMHRVEAGGIKVERWDLQGARQLIEVSTNGKDSAQDLEKFRQHVVAPLLERKVKPLKDSKTEMGSAC
jgi:hypothetical protein